MAVTVTAARSCSLFATSYIFLVAEIIGDLVPLRAPKAVTETCWSEVTNDTGFTSSIILCNITEATSTSSLLRGKNSHCKTDIDKGILTVREEEKFNFSIMNSKSFVSKFLRAVLRETRASTDPAPQIP